MMGKSGAYSYDYEGPLYLAKEFELGPVDDSFN